MLNSEIRSENREAKRKWLEGECEEIKTLQQTHNTLDEHKKLKETSGVCKKWSTTILTDDANKIIKIIIETIDKKN